MSTTSTSKQGTTAKEPLIIQPLNIEEEDALIHARITNDERPLRRITKKFHNYMSVAYPSTVEPPGVLSSVEEARDAFLTELASFQLLLRKSRMVCDSEKRQVDIYKKEKLRIVNEHATLKNQIEELKTSLEQAHMERRRKIEYDQVSEKINVLPPREELELSISALENDMQIIREENEAQGRSLLTRKSTLDSIVSDLSQLRLLGKDALKLDTGTSRINSEAPSPALGTTRLGSGADIGDEEGAADGEDGEKSSDSKTSLNPSAKLFTPRHSTPLLHISAAQLSLQDSTSSSNGVVIDTPILSHEVSPAATPAHMGSQLSSPRGDDSQLTEPINKPEEGEHEEGEEGEEVEDIEMGEVSEKDVRSHSHIEDKEEGEASDESSELSDPPDD